MIKKHLITITVLFIAFAITGCGNEKSEKQPVELPIEEIVQKDIVMQISVDNLKLRDAPNLESNTIKLLPINSQVIYKGEKSEKKTIVPINSMNIEDFWYNVETIDGKQGWLHGCCIFDTTTKNLGGNYPEGSQRLLKEEELESLDYENLSIMRNEIYARNGFKFPKDKKAALYFESKGWYKSKPEVKDVQLTGIEKYNVTLIENIEDIQQLEAEYESDQQEYGDNSQNDKGLFPNSNLKDGDKFQIEFDGNYYTIDHTEWKKYKEDNKGEWQKIIKESLEIRTALHKQNPQQLNLVANGMLRGINSDLTSKGMSMPLLSKIQAFNLLAYGDLQFE